MRIVFKFDTNRKSVLKKCYELINYIIKYFFFGLDIKNAIPLCILLFN